MEIMMLILDRISALPDALIYHILSFIPTKDTVATSVLSSRWRYHFSPGPDIDIDISIPVNLKDTSLVSEIEKAYDKALYEFMAFSVRLLQLRNGAPIRKLRLLLWRMPKSIDAFLSAVPLCHVQEIHVTVQESETHHWGLLPVGTFTRKTLVVLHLEREGDMKIHCAVSLPNLEVLYLESLILVDEDSLPRLIKGCPFLEELHVNLLDPQDRDNLDNILVTHVFGDSLKKLFLDCPCLQKTEYTCGCNQSGAVPYVGFNPALTSIPIIF